MAVGKNKTATARGGRTHVRQNARTCVGSEGGGARPRRRPTPQLLAQLPAARGRPRLANAGRRPPPPPGSATGRRGPRPLCTRLHALRHAERAACANPSSPPSHKPHARDSNDPLNGRERKKQQRQQRGGEYVHKKEGRENEGGTGAGGVRRAPTTTTSPTRPAQALTPTTRGAGQARVGSTGASRRQHAAATQR